MIFEEQGTGIIGQRGKIIHTMDDNQPNDDCLSSGDILFLFDDTRKCPAK